MVEIKYENLYGVTLEKLQLAERENIELRAICLSYNEELNSLNEKIEELNKKIEEFSNEVGNREGK